MAIKVIAQRREVKLGKNPGVKFVILGKTAIRTYWWRLSLRRPGFIL